MLKLPNVSNGGLLQERSLGCGYQYFDFYGRGIADFYGGGIFLRRKLISTEEAYFYGGGIFLRRKLISTEEADFYGGGIFLRRRHISTEEADFCRGGQFLSNRLIFAWKTRTIAQRKPGFSQERVCFTVCSSGTSGPP